MRPFHGVCAFPITPTDADGRVDTDALCRMVERESAAGVASIGLLGSTGIYAYLTRTERRRAVEAAAHCLNGRTPLVVGVGSLRTDEAQALARDAETAGADALLLAPVSYTPLTTDEVYEHCRAVASATGLPLCLYNNPSTTHFTFGRDLLTRLSACDSIRGVKMPLPADGDIPGEIAALRRSTRLAVGYSGDWGAAGALLAGADAWYSVIAGLLPRTALWLAERAQAGAVAEAQSRDASFAPLWETFKAFGSLRVMYVLHAELGFGTLHPPRPILPLHEDARRRVIAALEQIRHVEGKTPIGA